MSYEQYIEEEQHGRDGIYVFGHGPFATYAEAAAAAGADPIADEQFARDEEEFYAELQREAEGELEAAHGAHVLEFQAHFRAMLRNRILDDEIPF